MTHGTSYHVLYALGAAAAADEASATAADADAAEVTDAELADEVIREVLAQIDAAEARGDTSLTPMRETFAAMAEVDGSETDETGD